MKKKLLIAALFFFLITGISAQTHNWGSWYKYNCWPGLEYRLKNNGLNNGNKYEWDIQFRNNYNQTVNFSYRLGTPDELPQLEKGIIRTDKRTTLSAGDAMPDDIRAVFQLVASGTQCAVYVDRMRFGDNDSGPVAKCGSNKNE